MKRNYDREAEDRAADRVNTRCNKMVMCMMQQGLSEFAVLVGMSRALAEAAVAFDPNGEPRRPIVLTVVTGIIRARMAACDEVRRRRATQ